MNAPVLVIEDDSQIRTEHAPDFTIAPTPGHAAYGGQSPFAYWLKGLRFG
jgi:hypothetical protein